MDSSANKRRLCTLCAKLHTPSDFCPIHPDEPLLDPEDDDVRFELMAIDDRSKARMYGILGGTGGAIGFVLGIVVYYIAKSVSEEVAEAFRLEIVIGITFAMLTLGLFIAKKRYHPKFTEWTKDDHTK